MNKLSILLQSDAYESSGTSIFLQIITGILVLIGFYFFMAGPKIRKLKEEIENKSKMEKEKIEREQSKNEEIEIKLNKTDQLQKQLSEIQQLEIIDIADYKTIIINNEKEIVQKGGDNQLFSFMKIDSFLRDFRGRIVNDQLGLNDVLDFNWVKSRIKEEAERDGLEKIIENLNDMSAKLDGRKATGFDANVDNLFKLGNVMKPVMENQIKTMEYYKNIAEAMVVFYLNDKKIRYFEIYEAFEKLGVFDSTWQKNVLNKLDNIEIRLAQISNQLTELNQSFISLVESSENVVSELKEINSGIMTNNLLQAITAYQSWRINKNTKIVN
jgi:hypothetical protein